LLRYWYDDNGNRIREQQGTEEVAYTWDTNNRLTRVQYADGTSERFLYSEDGLRKQAVDRSGQVLHFVWDGTNLLGIVEASTQALRARFTHAGEGYGGLVSQHTQQGSRFYGFDGSANTRLLSDGSGQVSDRYSYTAFGVARQVLGDSFNPHRFGGQVGYFQDEDGRAYVRARHLDMQAGRWLNTDPIGFEGGDFNLYSYTYRNPISFVDFNGMAPVLTPSTAAGEQEAAAAMRGAIARSATKAVARAAVSNPVVMATVGVLILQRKAGGAGDTLKPRRLPSNPPQNWKKPADCPKPPEVPKPPMAEYPAKAQSNDKLADLLGWGHHETRPGGFTGSQMARMAMPRLNKARLLNADNSRNHMCNNPVNRVDRWGLEGEMHNELDYANGYRDPPSEPSESPQMGSTVDPVMLPPVLGGGGEGGQSSGEVGSPEVGGEPTGAEESDGDQYDDYGDEDDYSDEDEPVRKPKEVRRKPGSLGQFKGRDAHDREQKTVRGGERGRELRGHGGLWCGEGGL